LKDEPADAEWTPSSGMTLTTATPDHSLVAAVNAETLPWRVDLTGIVNTADRPAEPAPDASSACGRR
jgi:hypothetical protein